jgi:hypothetical protein
MTGDSAIAGIRELDELGSILLISAEPNRHIIGRLYRKVFGKEKPSNQFGGNPNLKILKFCSIKK